VRVSGEAGVPVLRARGVRVERQGARSRFLRRRAAPTRVVQGLDVQVMAGDVLWVVGGPGEGAAEVGQVLAGELRATSGIVELNGREVAPSRGRRRTRTQRQVVRLDADRAVRLDPRRTALEVVAAAAAGSSRSVAPEHVAQARDLLARLGLGADATEQPTNSLAATAAHLVDAARSLAPRPRVVVYQSPPGFDPDGDAIWAVLTGLRESASTTLVVICDRLPARLGPGGRLLVLCGGRVVEVLGAGDLTHPLHPYTLTLTEVSVPAVPGGAAAPRRAESHARGADETCPFLANCPRSKPRCATEVPRLTRPLGATHEVACHFPEDPRRPDGAAAAEGTRARARGGVADSVAPVVASGEADEPTAREFAEG
jgi:ABC-type glutathione transport system ATPase component